MIIQRKCIILLWGLLFYLFGLAHLEFSSTAMSFDVKKNLNFLLPQGWGFFTKNPQEVYVLVYEISDYVDRPLRNLTIQNTAKENLYGLSRNSRFVGYEISKILGNVPREAWGNGTGLVKDYLSDTTFFIKIDQPLFTFDLEKEYILVQYKPVPYAWATNDQEKHRPFLAAKIMLVKE